MLLDFEDFVVSFRVLIFAISWSAILERWTTSLPHMQISALANSFDVEWHEKSSSYAKDKIDQAVGDFHKTSIHKID